MAKAPKKAKGPKHERRERRFFPQSTTSSGIVGALGALGALAMGGGFWAQWGRILFTAQEESLPFGVWFLAGGAVVVGVAIWIGTSGEPLLRVGDGGIGIERTGMIGSLPVRRIPWHAVESIAHEDGSGAIVVRGRDETGGDLTISARLKSHPQAAAWIVREARQRIPSVSRIGENLTLAETREEAGESLVLDPLQVVGKRCGASGTIIAFEPDARVCPRCELVYHKAHLPPECKCGAPLQAAAAETASADESAPDQAQPNPA